MPWFTDGWKDIIDTVNSLVPQAYTNQKRIESIDDGTRLAETVFTLRPLSDGDGAAARATQRGVRLLRDGQHDSALREFHDAKQLSPSCHIAYFNLGCAHHMKGDDHTAISWYRDAHRLAPEDETATLAVVILESNRGQLDEATKMLTNFLRDVDASNINVLRQLAALHQREQRWSQAAGCYHRLITIDHMNCEWPQQMQICLDKLPLKDQWGEVVSQDGAVRGQGQHMRAFSFSEPILRGALPTGVYEAGVPCAADQSSRGNLSTHMGTTRTSSQGMQASPFSTSKSLGGRNSLDGRNSHSSLREDTRGAPEIQEACGLREQGRSDAALSVYQRLLRTDFDNEAALFGVANCQRDLGDLEQALEAAKRLLGLNPEGAEANLCVAELLMQARQNADMVEPYLQQVSHDPIGSCVLQTKLLCARAQAALLKEDHAKAMNNASEAVRLEPSCPQALVLLASVRFRVADYQSALKLLSAATKICGDSPKMESKQLVAMALTVTAQIHERLREYPQALTEAEAALDINPRLSSARVVRGMVFAQTGRHKEAESELERVLKTEPQHADALLQLGYCQLCCDDPRAVPTLEAVSMSAVASKTTLATSKVYLAMALKANPRSHSLIKEALAMHRNLRHVWQEIESGLSSQPVQAVQRLRGICDLDLTSVQARQLLKLVATACGRSDLTSSLTRVPSPKRTQNRATSVQPNRRAPTASGTERSLHSHGLSGSAQVHQASSGALPTQSGAPMGPDPYSTQHDPFVSQRVDSAAVLQGHRGRSSSPPNSRPVAGQNARVSGGGGGRVRSREPSQSAGGLELNHNEVIEPKHLIFGKALGSGGSAQVFKGSWKGHDCAIKKISGVNFLEELKKEINALRQLRHPRLVRFLGACIEPPLLLVVTEFMPGGSLYDRLYNPGANLPLQSFQRWAIALQMSEGIAYLHGNRVVHRDMKSMNVLLDQAGNAKICDFGLAQQMDATHIDRKLHGEGGSPRYMAPECYDAKHGKLTEKMDIWAMGCILIEVFGHVLPYHDCQTMAQLSSRILVERRPPDVPAAVPRPLVSVIQGCCAYEMSRRFAATDLCMELGKAHQMSQR